MGVGDAVVRLTAIFDSRIYYLTTTIYNYCMSGDINRGSEWNKWDLHIHSPLTWLENRYKDNGETIESFIDKIKAENIKAVGLTNYFNFAEKEIGGNDSIKAKLEAEGIIVFPCIEFRLEVQNEDNKKINQHVLFRNDLEYSKIRVFLDTLLTNDGNSCSSVTSGINAEEAQISSDTLFNGLKNCHTLEMYKDYLLIGCPYGYGGFRPSAAAGRRILSTAKELDKKSHLFFSSERPEDDKEFYLRAKRYDGCIPKPVILASDAHENRNIGEKYTWIKGDLTFTTLLQAIYSPEERTAFGDYAPDELKDNSLIIDSIEYGGKKLYFNKNINSVIGKRGSGKSNLLKLLAISLDDDEYRNRIKNDTRIDSDKKFISENYPGLEVKWMDGAVSNERKVLYIPQSYIGNLSYEDGAKVQERDDFITSILMNNESFSNAEKSIKQHIIDTKNSIDERVERIFEIIEERKKSLDLIKSLGDEQSLRGQLKDLSDKIDETSRTLKISREELNQYTDSASNKETLLKKQSIIIQDISILEATTPSAESVQIIDSKLSSLSKEVHDKIKNQYKKTGAESLKCIINNQISTLKKNAEAILKEIDEENKIIDGLKSKVDQYAESVKIAKRQKEIESTVKKISSRKSELVSLEKEFDKKLDEIEDKYGEYKSGIQKILGTIDEIDFEYLSIDYRTAPKLESYSQFIERNVNTNKIKYISELSKKFIDEKIVTDGSIKAIIRDIVDERLFLKTSARGKKEAVKELLENVESINYLDSIKTNDGKTCFRDMTGGQKAIAILELLLKFDTSKYPILIDQPEDDLDADGISLHLTGFIKQQARERQFIIVTHNASLVVNADSDNVIVAVPPRNNHGFMFFNGAIEKADIAKQIMDIMEGGEAVLRQRINKLLPSQC